MGLPPRSTHSPYTTLTGSITTSGTQDYDGAVTLSTDTTTKGTTVTFGDTVTGAQALTVDGNAVFNGAVDIRPLPGNALSTINTATITTSGTQDYDGAVTLS